MNEIEERLRARMHDVVPEPPPAPLPPHAVAAQARGRRRRHRVIGAVAASAAVIAVAAGSLALPSILGDDAPDRAAGPGATDPYQAAQCPSPLPRPKPSTEVPTLDEAVAVRLCFDAEQFDEQPGLSDETLRSVAIPDALVGDLGGFADAVASLPAQRIPACRSRDDAQAGWGIGMELADGTTVAIPLARCQGVEVDGRTMRSDALAYSFVAALDRQRERLDYTRIDQEPPSCSAAPSAAPSRPGREHLVAATACGPGGREGVPLTASALERLQRAWGDASRTSERRCRNSRTGASSVVARTDRGDLVQLDQTRCGDLTHSALSGLDGSADGRTFFWRIPVTVDSLR